MVTLGTMLSGRGARCLVGYILGVYLGHLALVIGDLGIIVDSPFSLGFLQV